ncbi:CBS domain-containing protein [Candidatus Micrarchaeota archaeon]|nr:CBS domain-containing protein [Candidatus Micrarchaeota archaeon]
MKVKEIRVGDCMKREVVTLKEENTVMEAAKLMREKKIGSVVILKDDVPVGIATEGDITYKVVAEGKDPRKTLMKEIMHSKLKTVGPNEMIEKIAEILRDEGIKRLPVVNDKGKLIGIIGETDIIRISPGLYEIIRERTELENFGASELLSGNCEICGNYSEALKKSGGKLACEECIEEESV